jgi:hypothetical protein
VVINVIRIVCSADCSECDLSGSPNELSKLARRIADWSSSATAPLEIAADPNCDPAPYDLTIPQFILRCSRGPVCLVVDSGALVASGSAEAFARFASWFEFSPDTPIGHHVHFDNVWGNDNIDQATIALIISCRAA